MNDSSIKFIAGLIFIITWLDQRTVAKENPHCKEHQLAHSITVNCSNALELSMVPTDLNPNLINLDISNNHLCKFNSHNFSKYTSLQSLKMTNLKCETVITLENDTFEHLSSLQILDISNSPICSFGRTRFIWPKHLQQLQLRNVPNVAFDFSEIEDLQYLEVSNCNKHYFPTLYDLAPINYIDLQKNNISYITVEEIAKFCSISVLKIDRLLDDSKNSPKKPESPYDDFPCMCKRLKTWADIKHIDGMKSMTCTSFKSTVASSEIPCNMSFDTAEELYKSCRKRKYIENLMFYLHTTLSVILTLLILIPMLFCLKKAFSIYKGRRNQIFKNDFDDSIESIYENGYEFENEKQSLPSPKRSPSFSKRSTPSPKRSPSFSKRSTPSPKRSKQSTKSILR